MVYLLYKDLIKACSFTCFNSDSLITGVTSSVAGAGGPCTTGKAFKPLELPPTLGTIITGCW